VRGGKSSVAEYTGTGMAADRATAEPPTSIRYKVTKCTTVRSSKHAPLFSTTAKKQLGISKTPRNASRPMKQPRAPHRMFLNRFMSCRVAELQSCILRLQPATQTKLSRLSPRSKDLTVPIAKSFKAAKTSQTSRHTTTPRL
jgi:hypothetical protein